MTTDLSDVMEHLAIAFAGIYQKLGERDRDVQELRAVYRAQQESVEALANRIESVHRSLSKRIEHALDVAAGRDAR